MAHILPNDLKRQYDLHAEEYRAKALEVLDSGWYILGKEVEAFEREWAAAIGSAHCVGLASGHHHQRRAAGVRRAGRVRQHRRR